MTDDETIPVIEGDDDHEFDLNPVDTENPDDDDTGDMQNLPPESFKADPEDTDGNAGHLDTVPEDGENS
jgi:hypothetical protein